MQVSDKLLTALNVQVGHELGASSLYLAIASYFGSESLSELSRFFFRQSEEEREHALKFIHFIIDVGGQLEVPDVPAASSGFASAEEAVAAALSSEERVTQQIYDLVDLARDERNHIADQFLDWFVSEQLEEVASMGALLQVVQRAGDSLLLVEEYLAREGQLGGKAEAG